MAADRDDRPVIGSADTIADELPSIERETGGGREAGMLAGGREELAQRYQSIAALGRGGMGDVELARDRRIGREVAVKRMRAAAPSQEQLDRFVREARVQGGLEHPAVVPVHDFGVDRDGRPYIVMKRLAGTTLAQVLLDPASERTTLLRAFTDVCIAVEFAHTRGIVHRDLKPANIMLGEFGETYVIDWGVAHATDAWRTRLHEPAAAAPAVEARAATLPGESDDSTRAGAVIGTPAYMAPEQLAGEPATPAVDIYALGCILFETLARTPLHGTARNLADIVTPVDARASRHRADVPPELDAICTRATAVQPEDRFPTARALGDAVQAFLDGDRDQALRAELAARHLAAAQAAFARDDDTSRSEAVRAAARVLAIQPDSEAAAGIMARLLLEPPRVTPPALAAELDAIQRAGTRLRARKGTYAYFSVLALWGVIPLMQVRSWGWLAAFYGVLVANTVFSIRAAITGKIFVPASLVGNIALAVVWSRLFGPFMLMPVMICGVLLAIVANPWMVTRTWAVLVWTTSAVMLPIALEVAGILEPTWTIQDGALTTTSSIFVIRGPLELGVLIGVNLFFVLVVALFALSLRRNAVAAERTVNTQAWHLRQIVSDSPLRDRAADAA